MNVESFLDTNILVYAAAGHGHAEEKRRRALQLMESENFGLSAQILQEFYVTVVRKIAVPLTPAKALEWIEALEQFPCVSLDSGLVKTAALLSVRYKVSYWDAAVIAAAEASGATTLYTEELNSGQRYGNVYAQNPFL
ncbi:MAG: PIN domain-containing protein [Acidobacteria bacterium]|nr:PIN domain-containing protein [Acidobacteriota bacterium]